MEFVLGKKIKFKPLEISNYISVKLETYYGCKYLCILIIINTLITNFLSCRFVAYAPSFPGTKRTGNGNHENTGVIRIRSVFGFAETFLLIPQRISSNPTSIGKF